METKVANTSFLNLFASQEGEGCTMSAESSAAPAQKHSRPSLSAKAVSYRNDI